MLTWCAPSAPTGSLTIRVRTSRRTGAVRDLLLDQRREPLVALHEARAESEWQVRHDRSSQGDVKALARILKAFAWPPFLRQKFRFFVANINRNDLTNFGELIKTRKD